MSKKLVLVLSLFIVMLLNIKPAHAAGNLYQVKAGDSLWRIATKHGTTVKDLKLTNGLQSNLLLIGQRLKVPSTYEVVSGDTLWKISLANKTTVQRIKSINGLSSNLILVGQKLKIPPKQLRMQGQYILMTRGEFKDWILNHKFTRKVSLIQQHHTWDPNYSKFNGSNHFALLKGMENYHVNQMGWKTISQQLTTFPDGTVAVGRPFNMAPEGSFGLKNEARMKEIEAEALAIENVGNFDVGGNTMTKEQRETIIYITALLNIKYGLTPSVDSVTYHHWWDIYTGERVLNDSAGHSVKTCPGTGFFGGNSTHDAQAHFYPLVRNKMNEILATLR